MRGRNRGLCLWGTAGRLMREFCEGLVIFYWIFFVGLGFHFLSWDNLIIYFIINSDIVKAIKPVFLTFGQ